MNLRKNRNLAQEKRRKAGYNDSTVFLFLVIRNLDDFCDLSRNKNPDERKNKFIYVHGERFPGNLSIILCHGLIFDVNVMKFPEGKHFSKSTFYLPW